MRIYPCRGRLSRELTTSEKTPEQKKTSLISSATRRSAWLSYGVCSSAAEESLGACGVGHCRAVCRPAAQHRAQACLQASCKNFLSREFLSALAAQCSLLQGFRHCVTRRARNWWRGPGRPPVVGCGACLSTKHRREALQLLNKRCNCLP